MKYLYKKDGIVFVECENCKRVLKFKEYQLDEVSTGVTCFCENESHEIKGLPKKSVSTVNMSVTKPVQSTMGSSTLKCPTCGSTNVSKISFSSKAVGGALFGLFSSNIRNTFKCSNCGYKW